MQWVAEAMGQLVTWTRAGGGGGGGRGSSSSATGGQTTGRGPCLWGSLAAVATGSWRRAVGPGGGSGVSSSHHCGAGSGRLGDQVVLLVGVLLLQVTCGQQSELGPGSNKHVQYTAGADVRLTQEEVRNLQQEDQLSPYHRVPKAVSIQDFSEVLKSATSYHDVLRAFYGSVLTDEAIDNIMASNPQRRYYSSAFGRPRIGGLSDSMAFAMGPPHLQGMPALMHDDATLMRSAYSIPSGRRRHRHGTLDTKIGRKLRRGDRRRGRKNKKKDHDAALEHYREMETKAQCRLPVPVVLRIRDISNAASKVYFPECTIVHRCREDSGCCNETSMCASSANSTITRSFFALEYIKDGDKVLPGKQIVETLTFINHTACACAPKQQIPECQECPIPFSLRRENKTDCTCDCFYRHHTCIHIKKGKSPLHEHQLRLIKEGARLRPKCQYGVFSEESIRTGYCPSRRSQRQPRPSPRTRTTAARAAPGGASGHGASDSGRRRGNWG